MGLIAASVYILLLFLFIPFRYYGFFSLASDPLSYASNVGQAHGAQGLPRAAAAVGDVLGVGVLDVPEAVRQQGGDGGWQGAMGGRGGFPHHEVRTSQQLRWAIAGQEYRCLSANRRLNTSGASQLNIAAHTRASLRRHGYAFPMDEELPHKTFERSLVRKALERHPRRKLMSHLSAEIAYAVVT